MESVGFPLKIGFHQRDRMDDVEMKAGRGPYRPVKAMIYLFLVNRSNSRGDWDYRFAVPRENVLYRLKRGPDNDVVEGAYEQARSTWIHPSHFLRRAHHQVGSGSYGG